MDIDAIKAPRTHATWKKAYDVKELAKLMVELSVQLEVELNVATVNEAFAENKAYMLEKELEQAQDCIKRLEEQNEWLNERHVMFVKELTHSDKKYMNTLTDLVNAMDRIQQLEDVLQTACYLIANVDWSGLYPDLLETYYSWRDNDLRPVLKEMVERKNKEAKP